MPDEDKIDDMIKFLEERLSICKRTIRDARTERAAFRFALTQAQMIKRNWKPGTPEHNDKMFREGWLAGEPE